MSTDSRARGHGAAHVRGLAGPPDRMYVSRTRVRRWTESPRLTKRASACHRVLVSGHSLSSYLATRAVGAGKCSNANKRVAQAGGTMARVFVSHAAVDGRFADQIHQWLVEGGHQAFLDKDIQDGIETGEDWQSRLHERLRWSDAMVCVITSAYVNSAWCAAEVGIAQSRGSRLLPVARRTRCGSPTARYDAISGHKRGCRSGPVRMVAELWRLDTAGGTGWPDNQSPFPGLRAYNTNQHRAFFGRRSETAELAALLRSPAQHADGAILLVVGPSGCGKSSLVRAGLIPVMAADDDWWTMPAITPGLDPLGSLARELSLMARRAGLSWTIAEVQHRPVHHGLGPTADEILLVTHGDRTRRLLVVVDQFEELITQTAATQRARFAELLRPALLSSVAMVATLTEPSIRF